MIFDMHYWQHDLTRLADSLDSGGSSNVGPQHRMPQLNDA